MKRTSLCFRLCLILTAIVFFSTVQAQQVFKTTSASVIGYLEYLPQGYNNNSNKYPVVIFLHGKGEKGPDGTDPSKLKGGMDKLTKLGPPYYVKKGTQFPFILICPQLKSSIKEWSSKYVMEVLNHVRNYLRIDDNRIYLTGLSLGGGGTWTIAQEYPDVFAAIAPVCGSWNVPKKACDLAQSQTGVWAFHGDKDTTIPLSRSLDMVNAINNCNPRPSPKAKITVYPGIKHNAWDKAYVPDHSIHSQNMYEWLLTFHKSGNAKPLPTTNTTPVASAGSDKTITLPVNEVTLKGSGSDKDKDPLTYEWKQQAGEKSSMSGAKTPQLHVSSLKAGTYVFRLTVKDNRGGQHHDEVTITVKKASGNNTPVASAGGNKSITLPTNHVVLNGKGTDKDKDELTYSWKQQEGTRVTMSGAQTPKLSVDDLKEGVYRFRLTVKDKHGASHYDDATITVKKASGNNAPVASAGGSKSVTLPTNHVVLSGKGTDKDKDELTYYWKQQAGARVIMSGARTPKLNVDDLKEGVYRFRLTVTDKHGASHYDEATITVKKSATANRAPVASAGSDKNLALPTTQTVLKGKGTDADKDPLTYHWKQQAGERVTLKGASTPELDVSDLKVGYYRFRLTVKDNRGGEHYDEAVIVVKK